MPPTQEMIDRAVECLGDVELQSFTASPTTITPFGAPSTLAWRTKRPRSCAGLTIRLNSVPVSASGSQEVRPSVTTTFRLEALMFGVRRALGTATVVVDTRGCFSGSVPEDEIRTAIRTIVSELDAATSRISVRSPAGVEVETAGIVVRLRFTINIDDFVDPDLNIDCTIRLRAQSGEVVPTYQSFSVDVDWPWWVTGLTLGVSKIVEEVIEDKIEGELRPRLLEAVKDAFDAYLALIPSTHRLYSVSTVANQVNYTVCPVTDGANVAVMTILRPSTRGIG